MTISAGAHAQADSRVPTVTRLVKLFTEQESALAQRIRSGDRGAVAAMVTDDFELRASTQPARPVPRDVWIAQVVAAHAPAGEPAEMAVHDLGPVAIASFTLGAESGAARWFVVDVWRQAGSEWRLAVRYMGPAASAQGLPGTGGATGDLPKRY